MSITFANPGILDPRAITTFGLNAKAAGGHPIGEFGTGLKIAIAVILRLGGKITIYTHDGDKLMTYGFATTTATIRDKTFNFVHMESRKDRDTHLHDSQALGFTTDLGKHWQPWMAYRELRSNMVDEGGDIGDIYPPPYTAIVVDCPEIEDAHAKAPAFFLETKPLWSNDELEIHPPHHDNAVFYRGIKVAEAKEKTLFTYNILAKQNLTEDRTLDLWNCSWAIIKALVTLDDTKLAEEILLAPPRSWEASFNFTYVENFSDVMRNAIRLKQYNERLNNTAKHRARTLFATDYLPKALAMSDEQRTIIAEVNEALMAFGITPAWTSIRVGDQGPEEDDHILSDGILFVTPSVLEDESVFHRILSAHFQHTPWDQWKKENLIVRLMQRLEPSLALWHRIEPAQEPPEPTWETTSISGPVDAISGSEDVF